MSRRRYELRDRLRAAGFTDPEVQRIRRALSVLLKEERAEYSTRELRGADAGMHVRKCSFPATYCSCDEFPDMLRTDHRWHLAKEARA